MKRLTTDNPQGDFEKLMNFAYTKYNRVHLSYADGKDDIDLCEYVSKLAKAKGFDFSPEFIMEDGLFDNYDDDFAVLYYLAVQAAELRSRLKLYEDKLENGTLIELPCKVGDMVYVLEYEDDCAVDYSGCIFIMANNDFAFLSPIINGERNPIEICNVFFDRYIHFDNNSGIIVPLNELYLTKEEAEAKLKELNEK